MRLPAAYCGIVGLKPSYGRLSRWGVVAYSNSLDTVGILAKNSSTVRHVFGKGTYCGSFDIINSLWLDAIDGYDDRDPTSMPRETRDRIDLALALRRDKRKSGTLCIGVPIVS